MSALNKENFLKEYPYPASINCTSVILDQMRNCICKIINIPNEGAGFFCYINKENILVMITNNHVINEEILKNNSKLEVSLNDDIEKIEINLKNKKLYTSKVYDVTIIELNVDEIQHYIDLDESIFEDNKNIYNKSIYIPQYYKYNPKERKAAVSYGIIKELINGYNINHVCNTGKGSSGSPILDISNNKVVGVHSGFSESGNFNIGTYLKYPINEYLNNKNLIKKDNNILIILKIEKKDINKEIYFLNNDNKVLKELNELNTQLFINKIEYKYKRYFKPTKEGIYEIKLKFKAIKNCSFMFNRCKNIISLDLSSFDTNNVTNMSNMFSFCLNLTSLDLSYFDTNNVTDMSNMFLFCKNITKLDLSYFDTNNVTNMNNMFSLCQNLTSLDLFSFDTNNVTDMSYMFHGCENLKNLILIIFNTAKVTNMSYMFHNCANIIDLDLSSFNTNKVTKMNSMFFNCNNLVYLKLYSFNTSKVTNIDFMFYNCKKIKYLDLSIFDTSKVEDMSCMFYGCNNLINLDLSSFNTEEVKYMEQMFEDCRNIINLDLSNFNTKKAISVDNIFLNCKNLKKVKLKKALNENIIENLTKIQMNVIIDEK